MAAAGVSFCVKVAAGVVFLLFVSTTARAGPGLDLVVVVDRSTSMAGDARPAALLLRMTLDLLARNAVHHRLDHRLAVVGFGSSASVDLPFTPIGRKDLSELRRRLLALPAKDRGDTDVLAAFVAADDLLRGLPPDPERRRAIVLLTDGVPYVRGADMIAYRARLQQFVATRLANVSVHVLLAGEPRNRALWQGLAREVHATPRAPDAVLAAAHGVITQLAGTRAAESAPSKTGAAVDTLVVPPYLDVVVFDVFRASPDAEVAIHPPGSTAPIRGGANGVEAVGVGDVLATLVVPRPKPGEWTIRKSRPDARVRILSQQFFPRGALVAPAPTDDLRQHDRLSLAYRVVDGNDRPLDEVRGYALAVEISLARPNGKTSLVAMQPDGTLGRMVFRSAGETECDLAGRYWTDVRITTTDARGRRLEVFRDRWSGFSVAPAQRVDCRVSASTATALLPMTTRVDCALGKQPIDMRAIAHGSPSKLFRALLSREGRTVDAALDLRYLGRGTFRGRLCGAWRGGAYDLRFAAARPLLRSAYNVRFTPARLSFVRRTAMEWIAISLVAAAALIVIVAKRRKTRA